MYKIKTYIQKIKTKINYSIVFERMFLIFRISQTNSNQWGENPKRDEEINISQISQENDSKPDVVICPYCGAKIRHGRRFCDHCGV